jgi:hypothetical protein
MKPIPTVDEAKLRIKSFAGAPEDFVLTISDEIQDPVGVNMAIITDCILAPKVGSRMASKRVKATEYRYKLLE